MKNSIVSLCLVFSTLFCLAFACGNNDRPPANNVIDKPPVYSSGLPAGRYSCQTSVSIYAGRGAGGYPIYNTTRQTRGSIDVKANGTYTNPDGSNCHYSYDAETGEITWTDGTFRQASSSSLVTDDAGNSSIQIKFNGDKDVWDCSK